MVGFGEWKNIGGVVNLEALLRSRKEEGKVKSRFLPGLEVSITCMKVDVKVVGDIADSSQRIAHPYCKP